METLKNFFKNISPRQWILSVATLVALVASLYGVRALTLSWCLTPLPGVAIGGCNAASAPLSGTDATPVSSEIAPPTAPTSVPVAPQVELPPAWDGASRINILVLGLDYLDWSEDRKGPSRSDTMVVLTIDPQSKTAGIISVPRDLWVNIPGFDYGKLNMAYFYGDANKLPGGGPVLAVKTVERVLGVPIQYYAKVDFVTFIYLVNQIGGIDVYVEKKIKIDPLGAGDDVILPVGLKHLDGMKALAYARQRYTQDGDVDRARRTQQVILAIRDKVMDPANFASLISRAPEIYQTVQSGISTNMSIEDALKIAVLMRDIPTESIKRGVIDYSMVILDNVTLDGANASIVKPIPDKIRELRDEIFTSGGPVGPAAVGADNADLMRQESATIIVRNGTYTQGLALTTADYLKGLGMNIFSADNSNEYPGVTKIIDHRGRPYALRFLKELFKINSGAQIISQYDPAAAADIEIILGDDWAYSNPMP
ncbi:MAG: hypothetical protein CO094_08155 [Anaerolineae bacterium CG_4_9_14_3_um_filter_57_17]|nr:LCP family protein [bacterium]NCT22042.1 LCP family protein [bacterium]OIO85938.1 MAG: hypothetical protein AUK01_04725 [Anaerolineae bacterium CG2_30_57_67]PJB66078.1 MAG: hypothetical protein CO094_08155 [Anaerolineae bacterium CG_4_9_14_3_um_filter_57_17]